MDLTYLFLDRLALDRSGRQVLLCAAALTADGTPVPLLADRPRGNLEDGWRAVLRAVKASGRLRGLRLVCCDGDRAVVRAIQAELPGALVQFSLPHRLLAMRRAVSPRHRGRCLAEARAIFRAPSRAEALARYERWVARWSAVGEWAAQTFRTEIGLCLTFYRFPQPIRRQLRSAHLAARLFR
ncbi:MAG: transposase, partial [Armatimonadota bacterium]|nr:transposase [Armatimonadota bacterium]